MPLLSPLPQSPQTPAPAPIRVLIQTACYNVIDGVTLTIRKIERHILHSNPHISLCILTTNTGNPSNCDIVLKDCTEEQAKRRSVIYVKSLKLPVMDQYDFEIGYKLHSSDITRINAFNPTLIHITVPDLLNCDLMSYARTRSIPFIATWHSNYVQYMDFYECTWCKNVLYGWLRHTYSFLPCLYVPTPYYKAILEDPKEGYRFNECTELKVWGRGVDLNIFDPKFRSESFRRRHGIEENDVVICFAGRLVIEKSPQVFIDVIIRLHANNVRFKALVIGTGPYKAHMEKLPNTVCLGWLEGEDLSVAYASCDLFLYPSCSETFGNVTLEACASGLPVIVERGCSSHLVNGNGYLCIKGSVTDYYNATLKLLTSQPLRAEMGKISRTVIAESYNFDSVLTQLIGIYTETVHSPLPSLRTDNAVNYPWGHREYPVLMQFVLVLFWYGVVSTCRLVQLWNSGVVVGVRDYSFKALNVVGFLREDDANDTNSVSSSSSSSSGGDKSLSSKIANQGVTVLGGWLAWSFCKAFEFCRVVEGFGGGGRNIEVKEA